MPSKYFNPLSAQAERHGWTVMAHIEHMISIHSPRKQRDGYPDSGHEIHLNFNPLSAQAERLSIRAVLCERSNFNPLSAQAERPFSPTQSPSAFLFQSTLRASRETFLRCRHRLAMHISIHSPRKQRDFPTCSFAFAITISIHSPRKQRDSRKSTVPTQFYISIHSPRKQRDV